ncbi:MAG: outer membrane beta-barrel protein [Acidobacteria bacterium]|nr:outer membrane beta-barrel protein [Acidobacteriota bacterium]
MRFRPIVFPVFFIMAMQYPAFGQTFLFGVKVGVPTNNYFETGRLGGRGLSGEYSTATRRYTVGVTAEWRFAQNLGLEFDALYRRIGYSGSVKVFGFGNSNRDTVFDVRGNSWDFPLMVKYRLGLLGLYAAGGGMLRHIASAREVGTTTLSGGVPGITQTIPIDIDNPYDLRKRTFVAWTVAGGIEIGRSPLRVLPEIRYARMTSNIASAANPLRFGPDQIDFLLGFSF